MAKRSKKRSLGKRILWTFLFIFLIFNIYLAVSGRFYFYSALTKTYFVGQSGPGIYDLEKFEYASIAPAAQSFVYPVARKQAEILPADLEYLKSLETTSFLVLRNDTIVYEYYAEEHSPETVSNSFSTAKSVVGLLIAIAVDDGFIQSIDDRVSSYLSEFNNPEMKEITIRDFLTMSSGLAWSESGGNPFSDNAEAYYGSDLRNLVLDKKPVRKPGVMYEYTSMSTQVLCYILEAATKQPMDQYFEERLWRRIGSEHEAYWSKDKKDGDLKAYCCMYLTTRDYAKLGSLILNNGNYKGEQIVPLWYMREAFIPANLTTAQNEPNQRYGLHWWIAPGEGDTLKYARGILGQYVVVAPSQNLVYVRTGHQRTPDVLDKSKLKKGRVGPYWHQIGHPTDVFEYLEIALKLADQK